MQLKPLPAIFINQVDNKKENNEHLSPCGGTRTIDEWWVVVTVVTVVAAVAAAIALEYRNHWLI